MRASLGERGTMLVELHLTAVVVGEVVCLTADYFALPSPFTHFSYTYVSFSFKSCVSEVGYINIFMIKLMNKPRLK